MARPALPLDQRRQKMRALAITLGLVLAPAQVSAQIGNPAGMAPDTRFERPGVPAPNQTNYQDRLFAQLLTAGGIAEVELGKLAADTSGHDGVKRFADRMVDDHSKANEALKSIAEENKIPLPDELDADHKKIRADLEKLDGAEFDLAYMAAQIVDYQKAAQLLAWEIGQGQNAELQRFAARTLPTVLEHLDMAKQIYAQLTGEAAVEAAKAN
jgi:putative membrane protein